jgi:hypothetical protein
MYQGLNLFGAAVLLGNGYFHGAWPSVAINAVWGILSLAALFRPAGRQRLPRSAVSSPVRTIGCGTEPVDRE